MNIAKLIEDLIDAKLRGAAEERDDDGISHLTQREIEDARDAINRHVAETEKEDAWDE